MKHFLPLLLLIQTSALADTMLRNAGTNEGPVVILHCAADGGLTCDRPSGTARGDLTCTPASGVDKGCVSLGAQVMGAGAKHFAAAVTVDGGVTAPYYTATEGYVLIGANNNYWSSTDGGRELVTNADIVPVAVDPAAVCYVCTPPVRRATIGTWEDRWAYAYHESTYSDVVQSYDAGGFTLTESSLKFGTVSVPQLAQLCGHHPALAAASRTVVAGNRFTAPAQFRRLSGVTLTAGVSDGGLQVDGGASQSYRLEVYNVTTAAVLCQSAEVACGAAGGFFGSACAADAGALVAASDDVQLSINSLDCLVTPVVNICAEFGGLP